MQRHPAPEVPCKTISDISPNVNRIQRQRDEEDRAEKESSDADVAPVHADSQQGEIFDLAEDEKEVVEINEEPQDVEQDVEPLKSASSPTLPCPAEVERHRLTHLPFRSWCWACIMGRGLGMMRGQHAGRLHNIATIGSTTGS